MDLVIASAAHQTLELLRPWDAFAGREQDRERGRGAGEEQVCALRDLRQERSSRTNGRAICQSDPDPKTSECHRGLGIMPLAQVYHEIMIDLLYVP